MTLNPASSVTAWTAWEMSPIELPRRASLIPASSAARHASSSRWASAEIEPTAVRPGRIGDEAVERHAHVDGEDVAVLELEAARDPVDDHRVRRETGGRRIPLVALEGRLAAVRPDELVRERVQLARGDTGLQPLLDERERLGDHLAGAGHRLDLLAGLADDHATAWRESEISAHTSSIERSACSGTSLPVDAVVLDDRLRLGVVDLEPLLDQLGRVVGAALQLRTAERALHADLVRDVEEQDRVEPALDAGEHAVERLGLREVAREPVEHEPRLRIGLRQALLDHRDRQLVGHELPRCHDLADPHAELGSLGLRSTEHVAGRDVRNAVLRSDALCLRALPGPLGAEDEEIHRRKPS